MMTALQQTNPFDMLRHTLAPTDVRAVVHNACASCVRLGFLRPGVGLKSRVTPEGARAMLDARQVTRLLTIALRWVGACGC